MHHFTVLQMAADSCCGCIHWWFSGRGADCSLLPTYSILGYRSGLLNYQIFCCRAYPLVSMLWVVTCRSISLELTKIHSFALRDDSVAASRGNDKPTRACCSCRRCGIDSISCDTMLAPSTRKTPVVIGVVGCSLCCSRLLSSRGHPLSAMRRDTLLLEHVRSHSVICAAHTCDRVRPGSVPRYSSRPPFVVLDQE